MWVLQLKVKLRYIICCCTRPRLIDTPLSSPPTAQWCLSSTYFRHLRQKKWRRGLFSRRTPSAASRRSCSSGSTPCPCTVRRRATTSSLEQRSRSLWKRRCTHFTLWEGPRRPARPTQRRRRSILSHSRSHTCWNHHHCR